MKEDMRRREESKDAEIRKLREGLKRISQVSKCYIFDASLMLRVRGYVGMGEPLLAAQSYIYSYATFTLTQQ